MTDFIVTIALIVATAIISYRAFQDYSLRGKLIFNPYIINKNKEWYRFVSHGFIHADYNHLIFNMLTLFFFGRLVEGVFGELFGTLGRFVYLLFYLVGIAVASIASFRKHKNYSGYSALGASGAVSAVLFASILMDPWNGIYLFFIPIPIPGIIFGIGYLIYSSYMGKRGTDNIGHDAHFYGAVYGFILPILLKPQLGMFFLQRLLGGL